MRIKNKVLLFEKSMYSTAFKFSNVKLKKRTISTLAYIASSARVDKYCINYIVRFHGS